MTSVSSLGSAATTLTKVYSPLDTNKDGVVSTDELAAGRSDTQSTTSDSDSTSSAADKLAEILSSLVMDLQASGEARPEGKAGDMPPPPPPPGAGRDNGSQTGETSNSLLTAALGAYQAV